MENEIIESFIYGQKRDILIQVEGVGMKTANVLLSTLPELGKVQRRQIASLSGLAPHPKQSGQKTWYSSTTGGRRNLRPVLFLAALAASKTKSKLGDFSHLSRR